MGIFDKAKDALSSDKGEEYSDKGLDAAGNAADNVSGGKHSDKIDGVRDNLDGRIGNEGAGDTSQA
ncbi:antitoxin [Georgenia sp. Z1491]|uniref:antitoxin n=1 Tax=Georgenia sp. Z1491 TaxID=3416707 RepID=UPI003CEA60FE